MKTAYDNKDKAFYAIAANVIPEGLAVCISMLPSKSEQRLRRRINQRLVRTWRRLGIKNVLQPSAGM